MSRHDCVKIGAKNLYYDEFHAATPGAASGRVMAESAADAVHRTLLDQADGPLAAGGFTSIAALGNRG